MTPKAIKKQITLSDGKIIEIETGKLAKQADGSVVVRVGNCMLLATAVSSKVAKEGVDFLPLTVDYQEKYASAGRFPGGYFKREARPSEIEILICRIIDRALRPLFPSDFHADTQVIVSLISNDPEVNPDTLAGLAASAAISISDIPFDGPMSEVRVALINGKYVINPSVSEMIHADLDLLVGGTAESIVMVEGEMKERSEEDMIEALKVAHEAIRLQCKAINELAAEVGNKKREYSHETHDESLKDQITKACFSACCDVARAALPKAERQEKFNSIIEEFTQNLSEEELAEKKILIDWYFHDVMKDAVRSVVLKEKKRLDGRGLQDIRAIWSEIDYLPAAHGSSVFTRGETQSLTTVTLGTKLDEQTIDIPSFVGSNRFLLHYNFPGFSTGEVRPQRGVGRREVGHGNLALRSLKQVLPADEKNPYTIRIVSDILESNGSSSMATVCAGSLALMDAGVQIKSGVSGIAMGLITDGNEFAVLSDILGDEDHLGDMDFKVTGTANGITACQMDLKVQGISFEVMLQALMQAKQGRNHILNEMNKTISTPNADYKPHVPRIEVLYIDKEFIGAVIGPGGKIIQEMQRETNTVITIEEKDGKGIVQIASNDGEGMTKAINRIKLITAVPEVGKVYEGKVKSIMPFGAFVEIIPGKEGLLHISEISWKRIEKMDGVMEEGEIVEVKLLEVDQKSGRLRLSRKALLPKPERPKKPETSNE
ncbi:MAG TPA: polyribonucleotide nucleotidyltransferase [Bacteroidia bacterium]|nr:polyribonucleotide nucleotidyltransferase [Bacteroidia bacterium]HNT80371.1 polyribonucleotide nucleotidyltransferase [Bacteroidia bacterium]